MRRPCFSALCLFLFVLPSLTGDPGAHATAQSLTFFDIDARSYPLLRAKFYAFDASGAALTTLQPADFLLTENAESRNVLDISCPPPAPPRHLSAVLAIDVSGSMDGPRISMAKDAAHAWIDAFPGGPSECGITSFTTTNALQQDFTNDPALLRAAVDRLSAGGGTSFDAALIDPFAGALRVVTRGRHKRVVVLLTDGQARGDESAILAALRQSAAQVYCVTLGEETPELLRRVSAESGGRCFSRVATRADIVRIYRSILDMARESAPCVITWESGGCSYARSVALELPAHGCRAAGGYSVTREDLPTLDFLPSAVVTIPGVTPGSAGEHSLTLRAAGRSVEIRRIVPDDARFTISAFGGSPPPFIIPAGQQRVLTVRYQALDSSYASCRFAMETSACEDAFFATAGFPGKGEDKRVITLLHPNGGEVFVAGSDTVITWTDVTPEDAVRLEFSADAGTSWSEITSRTNGLQHAWRVPLVVSDRCLVRITLLASLPAPKDMVLLPPGSFMMGDLNGTGSAAERPAHEVRITRSFYISAHEITQREWVDVMGYNPSSTPGDALPVSGVTWLDALAYCNLRSEREGLRICYTISGDSATCDFTAPGYRLPTEAEWEYACRAGSNDDFTNGGMRDPYCDGPDPALRQVGWYCGNADGSVHSAATRAANAFGIFDLHGNVPEWCWDYYNAYVPAQQVDPTGPLVAAPAQFRVYRGGGFDRFATECRSAARNGTHVRTRGGIGFRVVRNFR
ncbi:MAG: SUMF1/EgtB/PvdO family nonheme iron enzyme [Bacteroidota bacterium]|nr:SUMF1/EgtB/PvdO family nonheme iron enzyme [Bacteroidota bacterium]